MQSANLSVISNGTSGYGTRLISWKKLITSNRVASNSFTLLQRKTIIQCDVIIVFSFR